MDAICKELRCPICRGIYTTPILDLSCGHNFCKKCIQKALDAQSGFQRQYVCPVCSKVTKLHGKGIEGIKRNMFAENMVRKVTSEANRIIEGLKSNDLCFKHLEREELYCLADNQPICSTCKAVGAHVGHDVVRIEDIYEEIKERFAKELESLVYTCGQHANLAGDVERNMQALDASKQFTQNFVKSVGDSLVMDIQTKVASLMERIDSEGRTMYKKMQEDLQVLHEPGKLCEEMIQLVEQSTTVHGFLKMEASLRARAEKLEKFPQLKPHYVSHGKYVEKLLSGVDVKRQKGKEKSLVQRASKTLKHWKSDVKAFDATAYRNLDVMLKNLHVECRPEEEDSDADAVSWDFDSTDEEEEHSKQTWVSVDGQQKELQGAESNV